jgi:hypothetical protein
MTTPDHRPDARLAALFAADLPPARDPGFQAEVLAGLARRRFAVDLAWLTAACGLGAVLLGVVWPVLSPALAGLGRSLAPAAVAAAVAVFVVAVVNGRWLDAAS